MSILTHQDHVVAVHPGMGIRLHLHSEANAGLHTVQVFQGLMHSGSWKCCTGVIDIPLPELGLHISCRKGSLLHIFHHQVCNCHQDWKPHYSTKCLLVHWPSKHKKMAERQNSKSSITLSPLSKCTPPACCHPAEHVTPCFYVFDPHFSRYRGKLKV